MSGATERRRPRLRARLARAAPVLCAAGGLAFAAALPYTAAARPPPAGVSDEPDLSWIDTSALDAGKVVERSDKQGRVVEVETAVLVHAPARSIWSVLTACRLAPEYVPNVVSCESIERIEQGRAELFKQTVRPAFFLPRFEHVFRLDYDPYRRIDVHEISGPIKRLEGTWRLLPRPEGAILLVYSLNVDPGIPVPRFVVKASLKRDLPKIMAAVRDRAEAAAPGN